MSEKVPRRKLHNGKVGSTCDTHAGNRNAYKIFVANLKGRN
jgi:hypothetical protein